jgi:hypothetical protein
MSATKYGVTTPEPGLLSGSVEEDRRQEVIERETVRVEDRTARVNALRGAIGSASAVFADLRLRTIRWQDIDGGFTTIEKVFAGSDEADGSDPDDPLDSNEANQITLEIATQEQPLLSHPRYAAQEAFTDEERTVLAKVLAGDIDAEQELDQPLTPLVDEALKKIKAGIEAFYAPTLTLRERGTSTSSATNLGDVGKRIKGGLPGGFPATFGTGQNFLYAGLNQTSLGTGRFEFERVFLGSGFGGWDQQLYGETGLAD